MDKGNFAVHFHPLENYGKEEDETGDDESNDEDEVQEGEVAQSGKQTGDGEVEGNEQEQVAAGDVHPFAVVLEEEGTRRPGG